MKSPDDRVQKAISALLDLDDEELKAITRHITLGVHSRWTPIIESDPDDTKLQVMMQTQGGLWQVVSTLDLTEEHARKNYRWPFLFKVGFIKQTLKSGSEEGPVQPHSTAESHS